MRLQISKAVADMLNQQPRTADKGWFLSLVVVKNSESKGHVCASVDLFRDSVMGCDAEPLGDLCTVPPKCLDSITLIPARIPSARKRYVDKEQLQEFGWET